MDYDSQIICPKDRKSYYVSIQCSSCKARKTCFHYFDHRMKLFPLGSPEWIEVKGEWVRDSYAYMDDLPIAGWFWEVIRRTPDYSSFVQNLSESIIRDGREGYFIIYKKDRWLKDLGISTDPRPSVPLEETHYYKIDDLGIDLSSLSSTSLQEFSAAFDIPVQAVTEAEEPWWKLCINLPRNEFRWDEFGDEEKPQIHGVNPVKWAKYFELRSISGLKEAALKIQKEWAPKAMDIDIDIEEPILHALAPTKPANTLYIGISLTSKKEDIIKTIKSILDKQLKPSKKRLRAKDMWKYYIIVFDLKNEGHEYPRIGHILQAAYPQKKRLFDQKNIENYWKNAHFLIEEKHYRKDLFQF